MAISDNACIEGTPGFSCAEFVPTADETAVGATNGAASAVATVMTQGVLEAALHPTDKACSPEVEKEILDKLNNDDPCDNFELYPTYCKPSGEFQAKWDRVVWINMNVEAWTDKLK